MNDTKTDVHQKTNTDSKCHKICFHTLLDEDLRKMSGSSVSVLEREMRLPHLSVTLSTSSDSTNDRTSNVANNISDNFILYCTVLLYCTA